MNEMFRVTKKQVYRRSLLVTLYLIAFMLAEGLIILALPQQGLIVDCVILITLILHSSLLSSDVERRMLLALTLAPLARILSLSLPLKDYPVIYWYVVIGVPLFVATFIAARIMKISITSIGFTKKSLPIQILFGLTGLLLGWLDYLILRPLPLVVSLDQVFLTSIILLIFTGFLEELILRGVVLHTLKEAMGGVSIFYVAMFSVVLDVGYPSIFNLIFCLTVAVIFSAIVYRTGSILGVSLAHGLINIACYLIFPFTFTPALGSSAWQQYHTPQVVLHSANWFALSVVTKR